MYVTCKILKQYVKWYSDSHGEFKQINKFIFEYVKKLKTLKFKNDRYKCVFLYIEF